MTEQSQADHPPGSGGWHLQVSKLLVIMFVLAVAATGALIIMLLTGLGNGPGGGPPPPGPNGMPPPPDLSTVKIFPVVTGMFVLTWLAVLVVFARDQILLRLSQQQTSAGPGGGVSREELSGLLADLRAELSADRERDNAALGDKLAEITGEYGERRETDGYLHGMRMAAGDDPSTGNVRSLRRTPPPR